MKKIFITGISTDVGKTLVSAIVTEALCADYWKPIQAGELEHSDTHKVAEMISNSVTQFHKNSFALKTPMSPHAAALIDNIKITADSINCPETKNDVVIEGAGGLLVPLNSTHTILDIIKPEYKVIVVSRHYLGSINHTLMTVKILQDKGFNVSIIFSGNKNTATESIIESMTNATIIGRINEEPKITKSIVKIYADLFSEQLKNL